MMMIKTALQKKVAHIIFLNLFIVTGNKAHLDSTSVKNAHHYRVKTNAGLYSFQINHIIHYMRHIDVQEFANGQVSVTLPVTLLEECNLEVVQ